MEWGWPQVVFSIGLALRTVALMRNWAGEAGNDPNRKMAAFIAPLLITGGTVFLLHMGGFW